MRQGLFGTSSHCVVEMPLLIAATQEYQFY